MVRGASEGLGIKPMGSDFGMKLKPHLMVDASAAIWIAQRKGLGNVRHLDCQRLWIQDALRGRRLSLAKIAGTENGGDVMTQILDSKTLDKLMNKVGLVVLEGKSKIAPELTKDYDGVQVAEGDGDGRE